MERSGSGFCFALADKIQDGKPQLFCDLAPAFAAEVDGIAKLLAEHFPEHRQQAAAEALLILNNEKALASSLEHYPESILQAVSAARQRLETAGSSGGSAAIEARYARVTAIQQNAVIETQQSGENFSDRLDRVLTHRVWGTLIFVSIMAVMFQSIFSFANVPMHALNALVGWLGGIVERTIPPGDLNSLIVGGVIAGVGAVVVFLPQILLLFFFIGPLGGHGLHGARCILMDRLMSKVGLHGKSFIPDAQFVCLRDPGHRGDADD